MNSVLFLCSGNYYRSRFAEALFADLAVRAGLAFTATSAGLTPEGFHENPGPISRRALEALARLGVHLSPPYPWPRAATAAMLESATRIVALCEREHRPLIAEKFPELAGRVTYWHVDDVDVAPPEAALALAESEVRRLVGELSCASD